MIDLNEEQEKGIDTIAKWYSKGLKHGFYNNPVFKLSGPAGSGKSTLAKYAVEALGLDVNSPDVICVAPTGKASYVMVKKGLHHARTVHSTIYIPSNDVNDQIKELRVKLMKLRGTKKTPDNEELVKAEIEKLSEDIKLLQQSSDDEMQWILNPNCAAANSSLIVCDEAIMINGKTRLDLEYFGVPILYIADTFQLPCIEEKAIFDSVFFDTKGNNLPLDYELTKVHRQGELSPIVRYSRAIRENRVDELNFMGKMEGDGVFIRTKRSNITIDHLARAEQIIVGRNATRHRINSMVRKHIGCKDAYPENGDKIVILKNNKEYNVVNGMLGTAKSDYYDFNEKEMMFKLEVELENGRDITAPLLISYFQAPGDPDILYDAPVYSRKKNLHADFAYALTCHKFQGSETDTGILLDEPLGNTAIMKARHTYTGITRFAKRVIMGV
jgi:exodeoxyribonuclease-5